MELSLLPPAPAPLNMSSNRSINLPSSNSLFTPYEPPSHYVAHLNASSSKTDQQEQDVHEIPQVKKMDPYEEGEIVAVILVKLV